MGQQQPNILYIITDQQHAEMLSCAGNSWVSTPAMDRIAERGVRFERAYCSNPICVPSRFSLFTGRMPSAIGLRGNGFPWKQRDQQHVPDAMIEQGLGHLLRDAGYETAYGGKVHLPDRLSAEAIGFDYICKDERDDLATACADYITRDHKKPFCLVASFINPHDICMMAINDFATTKHELMLSQNCVKERETIEPLLEIPEGMSEDEFFSTHCPPLPDNFEPQVDEPDGVKQVLEARPFKQRARAEYSERDWRRHRYAYARLTEIVDRQIGIVLDALEDAGLADNTIIVLTSDHGDMDSAHRMEHKEVLYEESIHIPCIISQPGARRGAVDARLVANGLDLVPTLCDYAGATIPSDLMGRSLRPLVEGETVNDWREVVPVEGEFGRGIVGARYKYLRHFSGVGREQLYDLDEQPLEMRSVADEPEHRDAFAAYQQHFDQVFAYDPAEDVTAPS